MLPSRTSPKSPRRPPVRLRLLLLLRLAVATIGIFLLLLSPTRIAAGQNQDGGASAHRCHRASGGFQPTAPDQVADVQDHIRSVVNLCALGASLPQSQAVLRVLEDSANSRRPTGAERLAAVERGWRDSARVHGAR